MVRERLMRLGEVFKERLSDLIRAEISDPRLGFVTITDVVVSPDIGHAYVYVSVMGNEAEQKQSLRIMERASGHLRGLLGTGLRLKRVPELEFKLDRTIEQGLRVDEVIRRLHDHENEPGPTGSEGQHEPE